MTKLIGYARVSTRMSRASRAYWSRRSWIVVIFGFEAHPSGPGNAHPALHH